MEADLLYYLGQTYKIGLIGRVYVQRDGEWVGTRNLSVAEFHDKVAMQKRKMTKEAFI